MTCDHDYYNAVRKRAFYYVCPTCGADISLAVILIAMAVSEEEKDKMIYFALKKKNEFIFLHESGNEETLNAKAKHAFY